MNKKKNNDENGSLFVRETTNFTKELKDTHARINVCSKNGTDISELYLLSLQAFNSNFITEILSKEFVEQEINNKFLRIIIYDDPNANAEEIDERNSEAILILIKELLLKLNFTDGLAYDLLKAWRDYEEIVFDIKRFYREHFIHQFHDFLFGCLFLPQLWQSSSMLYNRRRFLRRWLLTAMYHDIGYPAESLSEMHDNLHKRFFNKIPNYLITQIGIDTYDKNDENLPKLLKDIALIHLFSENISVSDTPLNKIEHYILPHTEIYNLLCDEFRQTIDHGVTGAIFLLKTALIDLREVVVDPSSTHKTTISTEYEPYAHLIDDLFVAAAAIAGHNLRTKIYPSYTVDFSNRPIASLLNFCDDFQEWDRREKKDGTKFLWLKGAFKLEKVEESNRNLFIKFSKTEYIKPSSISWLCESLNQLFETNLSDINNTFYERIYLEITPKNETINTIEKVSIEDTTPKKEDVTETLIIIGLNTDIEGVRAYRIGRYNFFRFDHNLLPADSIAQSIVTKNTETTKTDENFKLLFFLDYNCNSLSIAYDLLRKEEPINYNEINDIQVYKTKQGLVINKSSIESIKVLNHNLMEQIEKNEKNINLELTDLPVLCVSYKGERMFSKCITIAGLKSYAEYAIEKENLPRPNIST